MPTLFHPQPSRQLLISALSSTRTRPPHGLPLPVVHAFPPFSTTTTTSSSSSPSHPRWLSTTKSRLGACILFGLTTPAQALLAGRVAHTLGTSWRSLLAGPSGFVIGDGPAGKKSRSAANRYGVEPVWEQKVLWGEMDSMGHVNNVRYLRYAETSRVWYLRSRGRALSGGGGGGLRAEWEGVLGREGKGVILRKVEVEYLLPLTFPDTLTLAHSLAPDFGTGEGQMKTLRLRCLVLSHRHQRPAARITEDVPLYDYKLGKRIDLLPWMGQLFGEVKEEEDRCRAYWTRRREEIDEMLDRLENETVKSGKEEDMGGV